MRREGFEPPTSPLSTECSASELTARPFHPIEPRRHEDHEAGANYPWTARQDDQSQISDCKSLKSENSNSRQRRTMYEHRFVLFVSSWFHSIFLSCTNRRREPTLQKWANVGSNHGPPACHAGALAAELQAQRANARTRQKTLKSGAKSPLGVSFRLNWNFGVRFGRVTPGREGGSYLKVVARRT
jgi:hypothetical protein